MGRLFHRYIFPTKKSSEASQPSRETRRDGVIVPHTIGNASDVI